MLYFSSDDFENAGEAPETLLEEALGEKPKDLAVAWIASQA